MILGVKMNHKKSLVVVLIMSLMGLAHAADELVFEKKTIFDWLSSPGAFSRVVRLLAQTRADAYLSRNEERTIFAPTDEAFDEFGRLGLLDGPEKVEKKKQFASFLICPKIIELRELKKSGAKFTTMANATINAGQLGKVLYSIKVDNGMIYVVSKVPINPNLKNLFK